jgi:AcrR family transcriptional regulator
LADWVYAVHLVRSVCVRRTLVKMAQQIEAPRRAPLSKGKVLRAAVALADKDGIESLSMRKLAEELRVVPMALYKHVASKDELLDGMIDVVVGEIDPPVAGAEWKSAIRQRILSARRALLRHPWASRVIESKKTPTPLVLEYMDSMIGLFRAGGFSVNLTHHVMHTIGSRVMGFTQELFNDSRTVDPEMQEIMLREMAPKFPNVLAIAMAASHEGESVVGPGCDDQYEFEFALDLLLGGFERLRRQED